MSENFVKMVQQFINTKLGLARIILQFLSVMVPKVQLVTVPQSKIGMAYQIV